MADIIRKLDQLLNISAYENQDELVIQSLRFSVQMMTKLEVQKP